MRLYDVELEAMAKFFRFYKPPAANGLDGFKNDSSYLFTEKDINVLKVRVSRENQS